ncbi:MAG: YDG domain-containing protein, partial [Eubacterium sp.]
EHKPVKLTGLSLDGADKDYYTLELGGVTGTISPAIIELKDVRLENQTVPYDGKPRALEITGNLPADVEVVYSYLKNEEGSKAVQEPPTDLGSYTVTASFNTDANHQTKPKALTAQLMITDKQIIHISAAVESKVYDGTTEAVLTDAGVKLMEEDKLPDHSAIALLGTATAAFTDANAGEYKPVTLTGLSLDGADKDYYTLDLSGVTGTVTPAPIDLTGIRLNGETVAYDNTVHGLTIIGELPEGVKVEYLYEKDGQRIFQPRDVGTYTVTAVFSTDANHTVSPETL